MSVASEMLDAELFDAVKAGSRTAAAEVFRRYYHRIVGLIRGRIAGRYRAKIDAESIVNSALKSYFRRYTGDESALTDWEELWKLLVAIADNKLNNRFRYWHAQRRDVGKEIGPDPLDDVGRVDRRLLTGGPEEEVMIAELVAVILDGLGDPERQALLMLLEGYRESEIATAVGKCERTVIRWRKTFQRRLLALLGKNEE